MSAASTVLAISVGDPAGVGPEVSLRAAQASPDVGFLLFGDQAQLLSLARTMGLADRAFGASELPDPRTLGTGIAVINAGPCPESAVQKRRPSVEGGRAQLGALNAACDAVRSGRAAALVTGPTSKSAITAAGTPFTGQTEHLACRAGLPVDDVSMLFLGPRLRVGLVTTHLSVANVPREIATHRVVRTAVHLGEALRALHAAKVSGAPRSLTAQQMPTRAEGVREILVSGLNPHAGEDGLFGDEEPRVIQPALVQVSTRFSDVRFRGPIPAEAAFRFAADGRTDGVVAMYHDQATIASKLLDWGDAVNVTWGLPFVRTSVDHGVAYDVAGTNAVQADGMIAAVTLALDLARHRASDGGTP